MKQNVITYILDDDTSFLESLLFLLESHAIPSKGYSDFETLLTSFEPKKCGCLIVDVRLKGKNGLEIQHYMKKHYPMIPLIIMSGHASTEISEKALKLGALAFFNKPIKTNRLIEKINLAINTQYTIHNTQYTIHNTQYTIQSILAG